MIYFAMRTPIYNSIAVAHENEQNDDEYENEIEQNEEKVDEKVDELIISYTGVSEIKAIKYLKKNA
ncbi:MAG: hypothetical protein ACRCZ0_09255 [Cetobacterium sp.]